MHFGCSCVQSASLVLERYVVYGTVMSWVTSQHHMCSGHVTFFYKRLAGTLFDALFHSFSSCELLVHTPGLPLSAACGWCLMCVGHDVSSVSPGWNLLPSSVIIVLALVNNTMSHRGLWYLNETWECHPTPCQYHFHRTAVPFGWCP